jgi:hydroxyethylthiazole kinase-like uncharacterized protein yjeF
VVITPELLRGWPLPQPEAHGDKEGRGRVLVVGGSAEMPGAAVLAGLAALRAGVGKLRLAVPRSVALGVALAVPEGRVFALPETANGAVDFAAVDELVERANQVQCVLFGPGMTDEPATARLVQAVLPRLEGPTVVLDATALACLGLDPQALHCLHGKVIVTPHAGEMASCLKAEKEAIVADAVGTARQAAALFHSVVALKGAETVIAGPDGDCYLNRAGNVGLATTGSGDTLGGIIAGLAARGAEPLQATVWGIYLHARAGDRLARNIGPLGYLARELLPEIPQLLAKLARKR